MEKQRNIESSQEIITDEQHREAFDQLDKYEKEETTKMISAFKSILPRIDYPSSRIKEYLKDGNNWHIGYCRVYEEKDYKSDSYPDNRFYSVVEEDKRFGVPRFLMRQDDNKGDFFHCLVWQTCQCEDCYNGYLLFPLTDGEYWVVKFEC